MTIWNKIKDTIFTHKDLTAMGLSNTFSTLILGAFWFIIAKIVSVGECMASSATMAPANRRCIKILAGYSAPEAGAELEIDGHPVQLPLAPGRFRALGMAFVHQDPGLIASLSVVENLRIGNIAQRRLSPIAWRDEVRHCEALLSEFGLACDPRAPVEKLWPWQRPMLAIIRAVDETRELLRQTGRHRGILVLDEPTSNLATRMSATLEVIRRVQAVGFGVLFVSHDLDEILAITDHVTVLRDGRVVGSGATASFTRDDLVQLIVGHDIPPSATAPRKAVRQSEHLTDVHGLTGPGVHAVDFSVAPGEILGVSGLIGSGFAHIGPMLIGANPAWRGRMRIGTRTMDLTVITPADAIASGVGYVPGERLPGRLHRRTLSCRKRRASRACPVLSPGMAAPASTRKPRASPAHAAGCTSGAPFTELRGAQRR